MRIMQLCGLFNQATAKRVWSEGEFESLIDRIFKHSDCSFNVITNWIFELSKASEEGNEAGIEADRTILKRFVLEGGFTLARVVGLLHRDQTSRQLFAEDEWFKEIIPALLDKLPFSGKLNEIERVLSIKELTCDETLKLFDNLDRQELGKFFHADELVRAFIKAASCYQFDNEDWMALVHALRALSREDGV